MHNPREILLKYWKFSEFRPLQEEIIQSVLDGKDTLALLPTGGGKSICFQVPALCLEGVCVVVSPLIALMKDQVYNLKKRNIPAEAIFSGMPYRDIDRILDNAVYGGLKFLYLSPERLNSELVQIRISKMNICLMAIDEAHCISQWGYDFRPSYLEIANIRKILPPATPLLALTATATPEVVDDIQAKLCFKIRHVFQKSFERSNLSYVVAEVEDKTAKAIDILKKVPGASIVYVRNRRMTREIAYELTRNGINADFYHAGLPAEERNNKQDGWMQNKIRVIVSTNAFGMGIDKPDVRVVIHIDPPDNLEAYFQEAGRAGRDEKKSYAVLLYHSRDKATLEKNYEVAFPELKTVRQVYRALGSYFQIGIGATENISYDFDLIEFCKTYRFEQQLQVLSSLKILEQAGWLSLSEAIFIPSSVFIRVSREELYDFQLKHKEIDLTAKALTRAYPHIFTQAVFINEKAMAHFLKIREDELLSKLNYLDAEGIIEYFPQKEKPQLTFIRERISAEDLSFDHKMYTFRKERHLFRIEKVIEYCEAKRCRSRLLLEYFGQKTEKNCGVCDYCLANLQESISKEDFERYQNKIISMLKKEELSINQIVNSFSSNRQQRILKVLEYMVDEGFVQKNGEQLRVG
ncbi:MAG: RecQ family ATP-dependent DNA helicase [Saprospiraceae bacterium]